ncbi:hypothetical protein Golob_001030 [Gossypium lobatum]|uniref:Copine C-terminal domain-containing protein n=1 Tax=Gossypium lobatum TaxID=34289 RepID=A0A7J8NA43_9ROSI|nr:hypothetical protein [Gossypium lobatum]
MGNFLSKRKLKQMQIFEYFKKRTSMAATPLQISTRGGESTAPINEPSRPLRKQSTKQKYGFIPDHFSTFDQVPSPTLTLVQISSSLLLYFLSNLTATAVFTLTAGKRTAHPNSPVTQALREAGLESSNLILGIDFTKSNEWTGKASFNNRSLHAIGDTPNPYEKAISIIGKTLAPFDEDNLIPCFGFGDATTHDTEVFSFHNDRSSCHGFEEVLACYRKIVPNLRLAGPTSYAPVIDVAVDIVENSGGQFHVLVIIADGQVTRSVNTSDRELSPQEESTINSIVNARYNLILLIPSCYFSLQ